MGKMFETERMISDLERDIPGLMDRNSMPGLAIALIEDAKINWCQVFGYRNGEQKWPVTDDTVFEAASLTKPVVALLALQLHERGILDLDAPLSGYVQEPPVLDDPRISQITMRIVLSHGTGFPNWRRYESDGQLRMKFTPGEGYGYSGEGYQYLQTVMEGLTGQPLAQYAEDTIIRPLGLKNTSLAWKDDYADRLAHSHGATGEPKAVRHLDRANAAYTMYTTATDFARFMIRTVLKPDDSRLGLRPETVDEMLKVQNKATDTIDWGLGWGIKHYAGGDAFWHWGDNGGTKNLAIGFRESGAGIVIMTNGENGLKVGNSIVQQMPWGSLVCLAEYFDKYRK